MIIERDAIKIIRTDIVSCFNAHADNAPFIDGAETLLKAYCSALLASASPDGASSADAVKQRLDKFVAQQEAMYQQVLANTKHESNAISAGLGDLLVLVEKSVQATLDKIDPSIMHASVPELVKEQTSVLASEVRRQLDAIDKSIVESKASLCTNNQAILNKVERLSEQVLVTHVKSTSSHRTKGANAEQQMFELLDDTLASHGFSIALVSGKSGSCDFNVSKLACPDIALELKAHAERVRTSDIQKFEGDLVRMDKHGIIVALHNGFVGKDNFQIDQLPSGKFAVYLAKNEYDAACIKDVIKLLHRLDAITSRLNTDKQEPGGITLSPRTMEMLQGYIKDSALKLSSMRKNLRDTLLLLEDVQRSNLGSIERILLGGGDEVDAKAVMERRLKFKCPTCDKACNNAGGLAKHMKTQHPQAT